jgi:hypothetical protein
MSPNEQRAAIAEALGIIEIHHPPVPIGVPEFWWGVKKEGRERVGIPDYLNDLNAMHEAEEQAGEPVIKAMRACLWEMCGQMAAHHATAAQRAEAFLRSLNLWRES